MSLVKFSANNHAQQVAKRGAKDEIDDRATPPEMFDPLNERFGFTIDVAAAAHNTKCERFYSMEDDGLERSWGGERVWCNPPFSDIRPWVQKAWQTWRTPFPFRPRVIVMLVPANRTEQAWWQDLIEPYRDRSYSSLRVEFLRGRSRFICAGDDEVKPNARPPFGCCLLIWNADA